MKRRFLLRLALAGAVVGTACRCGPERPDLGECIGTCVRCPAPATSEEFIWSLKSAYQRRDYDCFASLLHPDFVFEFDVQPTGGGTIWDRAEELRIHRRIFRPAEIVPPELPVPVELWVVSIDITLTAATNWDSIPGESGVFHAVVNAELFFETAGETDVRVHGLQGLAVKLDPAKPPGAPGRFLLIHWTDFGETRPAAVDSWHGVKLLYGASHPVANAAERGS